MSHDYLVALEASHEHALKTHDTDKNQKRHRDQTDEYQDGYWIGYWAGRASAMQDAIDWAHQQ